MFAFLSVKRLSGLLILAASLLANRPLRGQLAFGSDAAFFPVHASRLLADPFRDRVYAADLDTNQVAFLDPKTLQMVAKVPVSAQPTDLALSPDGLTLYVACAGSAASALDVVDLDALAVRSTFALPGPAAAVAAGLGGRVYVTATFNEGQTSAIYQLDGATGAVQTRFNDDYAISGRLQLSPDGKTLFEAKTSSNFTDLKSFDVSTALPRALQSLNDLFANGSDVALSHDGNRLAFSLKDAGINLSQYHTILLSAADLNTRLGVYGPSAPYDLPGVLAFSPDDSLLYAVASPTVKPTVLDAIDTRTLTKLNEAPLPAIGSPPANGSTNFGNHYPSMVADRTGSYLFVAADGFYNGKPVGAVFALATGRGTLTLPTPTASLGMLTLNVTASSGQTAEVFIFLSSAAPADLQVAYAVRGTAVNGQDYVLLKGTAKIKKGRMSKTIQVVPQGDLNGAAAKTVKLVLAPGAGYTLGVSKKAKVTISGGP